MKALSIRSSLTAWFLACAALLIAAFALVLFATMRSELRSGLDARLSANAMSLSALCEWDEDLRRPAFELLPEVAERLAKSRPGSGEEIRTWPARKILHKAGEAIAAEPPPPEALADRLGKSEPFALWSTWETGDGKHRLCEMLVTIPSYVDDEGFRKREFSVLIRVSEDLAPIEAKLVRLGGLVALLALIASGMVAVFAVVISRRVVQPLRHLGAAAAEIRAGRSAQIPLRGTGDEADELAGHLENAFGRLEAALQRQARFTSDASHELRNPITAIRSSAEVALHRERTPEEYRSFLQEIRETAERMGSVVEALLMLARVDAGRGGTPFHSVDLTAIARDAAADAPEGAGRVRVVADEAVLVPGDPTLLRVLVDNLIGNALRYSGQDAPILVKVTQGPSASLSVEDQGPGVPENEKRRVFERFFRGSAATPGSTGAGLGLALVAEIARVHGAECKMESAPGRTIVRVQFPEVKSPASA